MDTSRRSFLKGMLTAAVVSCVPVAANAFPKVPRIVGDGIHDDTDGFQAAIDGKPFVCDGQMVTIKKGTLHLKTGTYLIRSPLDWTSLFYMKGE